MSRDELLAALERLLELADELDAKARQLTAATA